MRLIDLDSLKNDICKVIKKHHSKRTILALYLMLDILNDRDIIKAAPATHGKWIPDKVNEPIKLFTCSNCKWLIQTAHYAYDCYYSYCPNCGAKMDGGEENA